MDGFRRRCLVLGWLCQISVFWILGGCAAPGFDAAAGRSFRWDFETKPGLEWSTDRTVQLGSNRALGLFNNRNRKLPAGAALSVENLPPNTPIRLEFDLYFIGDWDSGGEAADRWTLSIAGGDLLLDLTRFDYGLQNGIEVPAGAILGEVDTGRRLLPYYSVTHRITIPATATAADGRLTLDFMGYLTGQGTEFWALDNVVVSLGDTP